MSRINRRNFLQASVVGMVGMTTTDALIRSQKLSNNSPTGASEYAFLIDPEVVSRLEYDRGGDNYLLSHTTPWAIPSKYESLIPSLITPFSPTLNDLKALEQGGNNGQALGSSNSRKSLNALMQVEVNGAPDVSDITTEVISALAERREINFSMEFMRRTNLGLNSAYTVANKSGLPVLKVSESSEAKVRILPASNSPSIVPIADFQDFIRLPTPFLIRGMKYQFRGPGYHSLGDCVRQNVLHFNIEVFKPIGSNRWEHVHNYHIGAYRDGGRLCFVLFDNIPPRRDDRCKKRCGGPRDLPPLFKEVIVDAAARARQSITSSQAALGAEIMAAPFVIIFVAALAFI